MGELKGNDFSERYEELKRDIQARLSTPEAKERGRLFNNLIAHITLLGILNNLFCPICNSKKLEFGCHNLSIDDSYKLVQKKLNLKKIEK